jgi:GTP-binding protein EngB required for normal cell division
MVIDKPSFNVIVLGRANSGKTNLIKKISNYISREIIIDESDTSSVLSRRTITFESVSVEDFAYSYKFIDTPGYSEKNSEEWILDMVEYIKDKVSYY